MILLSYQKIKGDRFKAGAFLQWSVPILRINALPLWVGDPLAESQERRQSISEVEDFFLAVAGFVLLLQGSGLAVLMIARGTTWHWH